MKTLRSVLPVTFILTVLVVGVSVLQVQAGTEREDPKPCRKAGCGAEKCGKEACGRGSCTAAKQTQSTCPVMGGAVNRNIYAEHEGKRIYLCCSGCVSRFNRQPEKYIRLLEEKGVTVETVPASPDAPAPTISTPVLEILLDSGIPVTLLDARSGKYDDGTRIPGAGSLAAGSRPEEVAKAIPSKESLILTYCANLKCPASRRLAEHLRKLGYKNVLEYPEGIEGWRASGGKTVSVRNL